MHGAHHHSHQQPGCFIGGVAANRRQTGSSCLFTSLPLTPPTSKIDILPKQRLNGISLIWYSSCSFPIEFREFCAGGKILRPDQKREIYVIDIYWYDIYDIESRWEILRPDQRREIYGNMWKCGKILRPNQRREIYGADNFPPPYPDPISPSYSTLATAKTSNIK